SARCPAGPVLEVGGGTGNLRHALQSTVPGPVISMDVQTAPWLDAAADAHRLPFADASFAAIVLFDVLHHLERPRLFLREAARVLWPGGRLIMVEPAITPLSYPFYAWLHPEPVVMADDPLADGDLSPGRDPWHANQAYPTLLAGRHRRRLAEAVPDLRLDEVRRFALLAYPLSGGFQAWSLLPAGLTRPLLRLERALEGALGRLMAFRMLMVMERARP
ncbi:MAG: class I SAM-dependent methyltransferase, partial [Alphaproteobacteria bacterium]